VLLLGVAFGVVVVVAAGVEGEIEEEEDDVVWGPCEVVAVASILGL
jgi:hypothetical protein